MGQTGIRMCEGESQLKLFLLREIQIGHKLQL